MSRATGALARLARVCRFAAIPGGAFEMGDDGGSFDERPRHRVELGPFELGVFQVTNADYAVFLAETDREAPPVWGERGFDHPDQPVCAVSWHDARAFCDWLGGILGARCHLPTEAQRERAARGGAEGRAYPWGDEPLPFEGPFARGRNGPETGFPQPVGLREPNAYGLHDIATNVHEWCADWFDPDYYSVSPARKVRGPSKTSRRLARGGSWRHNVKFCRNAARARLAPDKHFSDFGFRVARSSSFEYVT
ncbi:MAG: SUMF1/EgtB/PvdO family nonheme iron enzyme [Planctomycetota bacterium]|nr:SUMF1/EgtB/PvdO family nonheme iron enzyme [Planctomycetota bacterium]